MRFFLVLATLFASLVPAPAGAANSAALFNGGAVAGCTYAAASKSYDCPPFAANLDVTIASGYKVVLSGAIKFDYNQQLNMSGSAQLQAAGDLDIGGINPANLSITGGALLASGQFRMGAQAQTIVADVSAASMKIGTGSSTKITGTLTSTGQIDIASHATVIGPVTGGKITTNSPVTLTGNVTASVSFNLASGSTLNGNLVAPVVKLDPSPSRVNGNVTASTSLTIGSSSSVNGNVVAGHVELESSEAYITGTAAVNSIKLGWHGRVHQTITCPAPAPGAPCNCVDDDSGYGGTSSGPVCSSGGGSVHHYRISHAGGGLTCQPKTVTLRACADASCSALYTGTATGTLTLLTPGGGTAPADVTPLAFSIASADGANNAAVRKATAGTVNLAVAGASPAAANPTVCVNGSGSSCAMTFYDAGFNVAVANQKAGLNTAFTVEALQNNNASPSSCIPLVASSTLPVTMRCAYLNPSSNANAASQTVYLGSVTSSGAVYAAATACTNGAIGGGASGSLSLQFDANGKAGGTLSYDDVGQLALAAEYVSAGAPYPNLRGTSDAFLITPHHYTVDAVYAAGPPLINNPAAAGPAGSAFVKAGAPFNATVTAISARNINSANFGRETPQGLVTLSSNLVDPVGGNPGTLGQGSGYSMVPAAAPAVAKLAVTGITWSEVGVITLTATTNTADTGNNLYRLLPAGLVGTGTSGNIGRFHPSHFNTVLAGGDGMDCLPGVFPLACQGSKFVYSAQPLRLDVYAMNGAATPDVTKNYAGAYARAIGVSGWNAAGASGAGGNGVANSNPEWKPADAAPTAGATGAAVTTPFVFALGIGQGSVSYTFSTAFDAPGLASLNNISRPVNVYFRATETSPAGDGVTSLRASGTVEAGIGVASGRLYVSPSYGTALLRPLVNVQAQYWTGAQIQRNLQDQTQSATALAAPGTVTFRNCTGTLNAGGGACVAGLAASPPPATLLFTDGASSFRLSTSGAGRSGTAGVTVNAIPWLPSSIGRVTYGLFRSPVIYLRELY